MEFDTAVNIILLVSLKKMETLMMPTYEIDTSFNNYSH